jgi:hypothetical protein
VKTPGDWIGWGLLVIVIGAVAAGFVAAADTPTALPFIVAAPFGLVGGVMAQIGIIGWGVAVGIRQSEQRHASTPPQRVPEQAQPTQPPTQPTQPPTQPTQPSTQPTQPSTQPTQPSTQPTQPSTQPTQPPTQPIEPPTLPTQRPDPNLPPWDQPEGRSHR